MSAEATIPITPEEYLRRERAAAFKSEFVGGDILAMAGAGLTHNAIVSSVLGELHSRLKGRPCKAFTSDMRVQISPSGEYVYPDVVAVCGERKFLDSEFDTLTNPTVVVEVLSPSTERYDRNEKATRYRNLASLTDLVLVSQDTMRVEHYVRQNDGTWNLRDLSKATEIIFLAGIGCTLTLADIYEGVEFPPPSINAPDASPR